MNLRKIIKIILNENIQKVDSSSLVSGYNRWKKYSAASLFDFLFKKEREKNMIPYSGFANSCATLVSLSLLNAGIRLKPAFKITNNETGMMGEPIETSAQKLKDKLLQVLGNPTYTNRGNTSVNTINEKIGGKTGILICTPCGFSRCTGHATVWHKDKTLDNTQYHIDNPNANIYFWQTGTGATVLAGAQGKSGGGTQGKSGGGTQGKSGGGYRPCSGIYSYGCKSPAIAKVQACLNLNDDGKFGDKTKATLKSKNFETFTDADIDKICGTQQPQPSPETDQDLN